MKYLTTFNIALCEIEVSERLRPIDEKAVAALAENMDEFGQQTPIEVVQLSSRNYAYERQQYDNNTWAGPYRLITGAHRYAAAQLLGWERIRAEIKQAEPNVDSDLQTTLREIDENLYRFNLNALDRAVFIGRRHEIWQALHPAATKHGGDRKSVEYKEKNQAPDSSFWSDCAENILLGETTLKRAWRISRLSPEIRTRLAATPLARQEGELYELTKHEPKRQTQILDRILVPGDHGFSVWERVAHANHAIEAKAPPPKPPHEVDAKTLIEDWRRSGRRGKLKFLRHLIGVGVIQSYDEGKV